jgi:hypothetical protein
MTWLYQIIYQQDLLPWQSDILVVKVTIFYLSSWSDIVFSLKSGDDNKSIMANYLFIIDIGMQE